MRLQSGTKLRLRSRHDLLVVLTSRKEGAMLVVNVPPAFGKPGSARNLLKLPLSDVFPLPKRSKAAPILGSMSCHRTPSVSGNAMFRLGVNSPGPMVTAGNDEWK